MAIRVEIDETIDRPMEDVFERLVDLSRYPEWMSKDVLFISCAQESEGPIDVGTAHSDETRLGTVRGEVSAFRRPDRVVLHYTARLLGRILRLAFRERSRTVAALKRSLESSRSSGHR